MKKFTIIMLLMSFLGIKAQETFKVSGKIQYLSYHQGGVELPYHMMNPLPLSNFKLYVVQFFGVDEVSKIVATVKSDDKGFYEVTLPPGKYGFIKEKSEIGKGVFLPNTVKQKDNVENEEIIFEEIGFQDYWSFENYQPFEVIDNDISNINITHYQITVCYTCP